MKEDIKQTATSLRIVIALAFILMLLHCGLLLLCITTYLAEVVTIVFGFYLVHRIAFHFYRFCVVTRLMLYYTWLMMICIWYERFVGFEELLQYARLTMFLLGLCIFTFLCYVIIKKKFPDCIEQSRNIDNL